MPLDEIQRGIYERGNWFHNMNLGGVWTAPGHFLGDYPNVKYKRFKDAIPADLTGKSVLDIGCNGGFYSIEMKKRGASRVLGIDSLDYYLEQARFAAKVNGFDDSEADGIEFRKHNVYDLGSLGETFDIVIFMGVLYHLRHPLLALDIIHDTVAKDILIFQSMQRGSKADFVTEPDYLFKETAIFDDPAYPHLSFVEKKYSNDETNWWVPNRACTEAMLRSAGFAIESHPEAEVYVCRRQELTWAPDFPFAVYPPAPAEHLNSQKEREADT